MSSFLIIVNSKTEEDNTAEKNIDTKKIYELIKNKLLDTKHNVIIKKFAFETKLPLLFSIDNIPIDYIIIDVPKRITLPKLYKSLFFQSGSIKDYLISKDIKDMSTPFIKKMKVPSTILLVEKESLDFTPSSSVPIFIEDIILKNYDIELILYKLQNFIKKSKIEYFDRFKIKNLINIFNKTGVIIFELGPDFKVKFVNKLGIDYFKINSLSKQNLYFFDLITSDEKYKESLKLVFTNNLKKNRMKFNFESTILFQEKKIIINWIVEISKRNKTINDIIIVGHEIRKNKPKVEIYANSLVSENKKLMEQIKLDKMVYDVIKKELDVARKIQRGIIPKKFPPLAGCNVNATYVPMDAIGGDYYDVFPFEASFGALIADVCGHGIPAALITAMTKVLSKSSETRILSPGNFIWQINNEIHQLIPAGKFVTLFVIHYDNFRKILKYASGGHIHQILYQKAQNKLHLLPPTGPVVGVIPGIKYEEKVYHGIEKGDRLVLFTDGIIEARNTKRELFGVEKVIQAVEKLIHLSSEDFKDALLSDIAEFSKGVRVEDDVSLMIITFTD